MGAGGRHGRVRAPCIPITRGRHGGSGAHRGVAGGDTNDVIMASIVEGGALGIVVAGLVVTDICDAVRFMGSDTF